MDDISVLTGSTMLSEELGYSNLERVDPVYVMGKCHKVQIDKKQSVFIKGNGKPELIS